MKKIVMTVVMALTASAASAQLTGIVSYDGNNVRGSGVTVHETNVGLVTSVAGFGAEVLVNGNAIRGDGVRVNGTGFEFAATKEFAPVFGVKPTVRLGLGRKVADIYGYDVDLNYWTAEVQGRAPLMAKTDLVVTYRHRNGTNEDYAENRVSVGAEYAFAKNLVLGASLTRTTALGNSAHGAVISARYSF